MSQPLQTIEPTQGATYSRNSFSVYELSTYPRSSVLAGQQRRVWLDEFDTIENALMAYPDAVVRCGSSYQAPSLNHLPDDEDGGSWFSRNFTKDGEPIFDE